MNLKNNGGRTALHYAASKGWVNVAEILIANGAKINSIDKVCNLIRFHFGRKRKPSFNIILIANCLMFNLYRLAAPPYTVQRVQGSQSYVNF